MVSAGPPAAPRVLLADARAAGAGVHPGMSLAAARALAEELQVYPHDPAREQAALERLAAWAGRFSSLVSLAPPRSLLLEVGGSLSLYGGAKALAAQVDRGVAALGYEAVPAAAPTPLAATWLARSGRRAWLRDPGRLGDVLGALPLECLDLEPGQKEALAGLGLRTLGECLRLPRDGLGRRFGPGLAAQLDQALGRRPDPRAPFVPPARFDGRLELPAEVDGSEALLFPLRRLLNELAGLLASRSAGTGRLVLELIHREKRITPVVLRLAKPVGESERLLILFRERLHALRLAEPVRALRLRSDTLRPLAPVTRDLFGAREGPGEDPALLPERLRARLGEQAVRGLCLVAEHRPERAWRYGAPGEGAGPPPPGGRRPLWLLSPPMPLRTRNGRPCFEGALHRETEAERIESGWWDGQDIARDYFIARNPRGERLWIFRERRGARRWFLHGIFG